MVGWLMDVKQLVGWEMPGKTDILRAHWPLGMIPDCCGEKPVTYWQPMAWSEKQVFIQGHVKHSLYEKSKITWQFFFVKLSNIKFNENPINGSWVVSCTQIDKT
jgi:hypothetical protein